MSVANQLKSQVTLALDADDDSQVTDALDLELARNVFVSVEASTGAHTTHVLKLQVSADTVTWHQHASATVTGLGFMEGTVNARFVRVKVTTEEGGASTVDVRVQAKP